MPTAPLGDALPSGRVDALNLGDRHVEGDGFSAAQHLEAHGFPRLLSDGIPQLPELLNLLPVKRHQRVADLDTGLARRARTGALPQRVSVHLVGDAHRLAHSRGEVRVRIRDAGKHRHKVGDDNADEQVHHNAAGKHRDALPRRLIHHRVRLFLRREGIQRGHARNVAEPAERQRGKAVLSVALRGRPHRGAKPNKIATHAHTKGAGGEHVPGLMQRNGRSDRQRERQNA